MGEATHRDFIMSTAHPLDGLSISEIKIAREVILKFNPDVLINFREIFLAAPRKLIEYLAIEHSGKLDANTPTPCRHAKCLYDVIPSSNIPEYHESTVDVGSSTVTETAVIDVKQHASLTL